MIAVAPNMGDGRVGDHYSVSIRPMIVTTRTVSFRTTLIFISVPDTGDSTYTVTFSMIRSKRISTSFTLSTCFLCHSMISPSVIAYANFGKTIS